MSTTTTYTGVRIVDMPDLGAVNDASSVVGELAGSGRFAATALRSYIGSTMSYTQAGTGGVSRLLPQRIAEVLFVDEYDTLAHAKAAAVALPLFDAQHGRLHLRTGLNASYDIAFGVLGVGLSFDTDGSIVNVPAGKVLAHIAIGNGPDQQFMLGASQAEATLINFNMAMAAGSDATSRMYGVIGNLTNAGAGSTKALYGRSTAASGSTGTVMGVVAGVGTASTLTHATALQLTCTTATFGGKVNEYIWCASNDASNVSADYALLIDKPVAIGVAGIRQYATGAGDFLQLMDAAGTTVLFSVSNAGVVRFSSSTITATAGTSGAPPAQVGGYISIMVSGAPVKIPFYAP